MDPKRQVMSITVDSMEELDVDGKSKVTVIAQILDMKTTDGINWKWLRQYVRFDTGKTSTTNEKSSQRNFVIRIPGVLVHPVGPSVVATDPSDPPSHTPEGSSASLLTWSLTHTELVDVLDSAWSELNPDSEEIIGNIQLLPSLVNIQLPYLDHNSKSK